MSERLQRVPSWPIVLRQQFRLIDANHRGALLIAVTLAAVALLDQSVLFGWPDRPSPGGALLVAVVWPFVVWAGESPRKRRYHWAMPVDPFVHDLTRVLAGGIWLVVAVSIALYSAWLVTVVTAHVIHAPFVFRPNLVNIASFMISPLIAYLLVCPLAIVTTRPIETFVGAAIAVFGLAELADFLYLYGDGAFARVGAALKWIYGANGGLHGVFISGQTAHAPMEWGYLNTGPDFTLPVANPVVWALSTAIWLPIGVLATALAARFTARRSA